MTDNLNPLSNDEAVALLDEILGKPFVPCVVEIPFMNTTEIVLKDCFMVWHQHYNRGIELAYDEGGELVAIRVCGLWKRDKSA